MNIALMLHHGVRENAPDETMGHPHLEMLAATASEGRTLKVLAEQLTAFGTIPFRFHEIESFDGGHHGAVLRIALCEREPAAQAP